MSQDRVEAEIAAAGRPLLKNIRRHILSLAVFFLSTGIAVVAVVAGVTSIKMRAEEKPQTVAAPPAQVEIIKPDFQSGYEIMRSFVGRIEPARQTSLAFELSGTVEAILVDEGDPVRRGDTVAILDTKMLKAERRRQVASRRAAESDRQLAALTLDRRQKLSLSGHVSDQVLDEARLTLSRLDATIAQIDAAIEAIDINLGKSILKAPFDGRVGERLLDEGTTVSPGSPLLSVLETAMPVVRIGMAPAIVDRLEQGREFEIRISGQSFKARLAGLRPDLQTRTRTIEALFELDSADAVPGFGRLAELSISEWIETEGFWVPTSALKEGPRGLWTVLAVATARTDGDAPEHSIVLEAVEVLHADAERSFVRGTISKDTGIVAAGVHRVVVGQTVTPVWSGV